MKSNLAPNVATALCYLPFVGWIAAIVFIIIEKDKEVRLHAVQAIILMASLWLLAMVTTITIVLPFIIWIGGLILQIVLAIKAYNSEKFELPLVTKWSTQVLEKISPK
ncbi:MAG: DUF4870 domain-containing protein [Patescibacteria group bacterium]